MTYCFDPMGIVGKPSLILWRDEYNVLGSPYYDVILCLVR